MIVSNYPAKRRENSIFPFSGAANDRMPVKRKLNGKRSKLTTLESRKKAENRHTRQKKEWRNQK